MLTCVLPRIFTGIYIGQEEVCKPEKTRYIPPDENLTWGQILEFNLQLKDIPRNARLCLSLHGVWANPLKVPYAFSLLLDTRLCIHITSVCEACLVFAFTFPLNPPSLVTRLFCDSYLFPFFFFFAFFTWLSLTL